MKSRQELEAVEELTKITHNSISNKIIVDLNKKYDPENSQLGYCYKFVDSSGNTQYNIVCSSVDDEEADFRVYMHEIGHIYLGHLDEISKDLDIMMCNEIRDHFFEITERINKECGIEFGAALLKRIIDDPYVNHSFHNIAMDMEINSKILSKDDVECIEQAVTKVLPKKLEETLKLIADKTNDDKLRQRIEDELSKMEKESKIKLILPEKYHTNVIGPDGKPVPFENELTYTEYLLLMLRYADQFVKMLVDLDNGGNGNTNNVTREQVKQALQKWWNNQSDEYKQGYRDGMTAARNSQQNQQSGQNGNGQQGQQSQGQQSGQCGNGQQGQQGQKSGSGQGGQSGQNSQGMQGSGQGNNGQQGQGQQGQQGQGGNGNGQNGQDELSDYDAGYQDALKDAAEGMMSGAGSSMRGLEDLMSQMGLKPDPGQKRGAGRDQIDRDSNPYKGMEKSDQSKNPNMDHNSDQRTAADSDRAEGKITAGSPTSGCCGRDGSADQSIYVDPLLDDVDSAIKEIIKNVRHRAIKVSRKRDTMRKYNRGIERKVICPVISHRIYLDLDPKIVFLVDVSGSMDERLITRILNTISRDLKKINRGLKYDIIAWNTHLSEEFKDVKPDKPIPQIRTGGGTEMARGMEYFKKNYDTNAILVVVSDFEDDLDDWAKVESSMPGYDIYGWNYGRYSNKSINWTRLKQRDFSDYGYAED